MQAKVVQDLGEDVVLDFPHPLTRMTLHFEGEVFAIREATEKEKEEGFRV